MSQVELRHEWKIAISRADVVALRSRLLLLATPDPYAVGDHGLYFIRSLYFDSPEDRALREKLDGVAHREKFRIRYYNRDTSFIQLEKKSKWDTLGNKRKANLTLSQAQSIVDGDTAWLATSDQPLLRELYHKMHTQGLRPKTIVDYTREAYLYPAGDVRITLDYDLRAGINCTQAFRPDCPTARPVDAPDILEVKWTSFLPDIIRDAVQLSDGRQVTAFSKYAACRTYW